MRTRPALALGFVMCSSIGSIGCGSDDVAAPARVDPLGFAVDAPGPFRAGHRTLEAIYESPAGGGARAITVHLWYPTEATDGPHPTYQGLFLDENSIDDAPPAAPLYDGRYRVLLHSHGHRGYAANSGDFVRYFASHGWVVVAPDHLNNTLANPVEPRPTAIHFQRPLDLRASLDRVEALDESDPLGGKLATDAVLMSGHSFGVQTAWIVAGASFDQANISANCPSFTASEACTPEEIAVFATDLREPRVKAIVPMAGDASPEWFGPTGLQAIDVPVLFMTGTADSVDGQAVFDVATGLDFSWLSFTGGCHQLFGFGGCRELPNETGLPAVRTSALAFARRRLLADANSRVVELADAGGVVADFVTRRDR